MFKKKAKKGTTLSLDDGPEPKPEPKSEPENQEEE